MGIALDSHWADHYPRSYPQDPSDETLDSETTMPTSKRKTSKAAADKAPNPAFAFLMKFMKSKPKAAYADAAAAAKRAGHTIYPIMWGRAQMLLGRVKAKPRGDGKVAGAAKVAAAPKVRAPRERVAGVPGNGASITIDGADVERWSRIVEKLNGGGTAALVFDGSEWAVTVR